MDSHSRSLLLTAADFDAFLEVGQVGRSGPSPSASRSGASGQGPGSPSPAVRRRALRERIEGWAEGVLPRLIALGVPAEAVVPDEVEQHLSSRSPRSIAQRAIFVRDAFARSSVPRTEPELDPLRAHAYLTMAIDSVHVEVSLEISPEAEADVKNLRARIADPTALLELTTLLETLPDEFAIGVIGVPSFPRAQAANADDVRALLDDSRRNGRPLWIGWSVKREVALAHASELGDQLADALVALAQAYKLVAWAPDNDLIGAGRRGAWRAVRAGAQREERRERGREERRTRRSKIRKHGGPVRVEGTRREREDARRGPTLADRDVPVSRRTPAPEEGEAGTAERLLARAVARRPILPTTLRARGARATAGDARNGDPSARIEKGTRVRVLGGPFANKTGVVQEIDGQGRARVRLGLLAATVDMKDLMAEGEGSRPLLGSSHRRPRNTRGK